MSTVIFDLDSTLADTRHRRGHLPVVAQGPSDWIDYHSRCADDAPIAGRIVLARLLAFNHSIVILTARPDTPEIVALTVEWLRAHRVPMSELFLMPLHEIRSTGEWKADVARELARTREVVLFVDDWWQNGDELEALGVPFLHVTPPEGS